MQAIEITTYGGPEVLMVVERTAPVATADQLLIRVAYAGVNGPDVLQRKGLYPPPPGASSVLGLEIAGIVVDVGQGVTGWAVGDPVCALTNGGGYAEYCTVLASHCLPVPPGLDLQAAASIPETYFTIWSNIFMGAGLHSAEVFLVHGGCGGLGTTAIQLGKAFGATVIATDSPATRTALCYELGADRVIDYREQDFVTVLCEEYDGADVILDVIGGPYIERNIKVARYDARIVQLAFALGSKVEINLMPIMLKRLHYTGSTLRRRCDHYKAEIARQLQQQVWPLFADATLQPVVCEVIPLAEAARAHQQMENAEHTGKMVLAVGG